MKNYNIFSLKPNEQEKEDGMSKLQVFFNITQSGVLRLWNSFQF